MKQLSCGGNIMKSIVCTSLIAALVMTIGQSRFLAAGESVAEKVIWQRNLFAGFRQAAKEKKPLVVLFTLSAEDNDKGVWCKKLDEELLDARELQSLAGRAVFVRAVSSDEDNKGNYAQLRKELNLKRFPVTVVLDVTEDRIIESGRILGYFKREKFVEHMNTLLNAWKDEHRSAKTK